MKSKNSPILTGLKIGLVSAFVASCVMRTSAQVTVTNLTSRVPKFTFGNTLVEQEAQLKTNLLMLRFAESRRQMAGDPHRPIYHYINPEARLNDPNGLSYWQGRWHLFYQAYPPEDTRQHWGHAVSEDLIHWRDLPYAIYPNPEEKSFSGAIMIEEKRAIAMYHGTRVGNIVAVSEDPLLLNWEKLTGAAVIPRKKPDEPSLPYHVYDPCIWKKDGMYYSISGSTMATGPAHKSVPAQYLFRSKDLVKWEYLHQFVEDDRFTMVGDDGACPYFWPIGDRHILLFFSHMSGGQYLLGDYDKQRDKFVATSHAKFNFGAATPGGVHAPSAFPDGKGGVIAIFNVNPAKSTTGWNQLMTLPRRLTLAAKDELKIEPAGDIESLRYDHQQVLNLKLPANEEVVLKKINGNATEFIVEIDPSEAPMIELNILRSTNKEEYTRVAFFRNKGYVRSRSAQGDKFASLISLDTSYSSQIPGAASRAPETAQVILERDEPLKLRVFVDKSVVEVFVNGKQCVAARVYPGRGDSVGVSLRSQGRDSTLKSLDAWQMKNIYEPIQK
jgi:beta-fructofuranosidase